MNGLKRYAEDLALTEFSTPVIRSHRRIKPPHTYHRRIIVIGLIVSCGLTTVASTAQHINYKPTVGVISNTYAPSMPDTNRFIASKMSVASRTYTRPLAKQLSKVDTVVRFALAQRGKPYVFGTWGPNVYDCSGLVKRSFAQINIYLPHYTGAMLHYGAHVSRANLHIGDIVFLSSHHVGIYIGHNNVVVAPHNGAVVRVQTIYAFYTARRML